MDQDKYSVVVSVKIILPDGTTYSEYRKDDDLDNPTMADLRRQCQDKAGECFDALHLRAIFNVDDEAKSRGTRESNG